MSSATDLITDAYIEIVAHSNVKPVSDFAIEFGRRKFQSMMQEWIDDNMDFGFSATEFVSDETSIPLGLETGIITNLAVRLAPSMGKEASSTLMRNAADSLTIIKKYYQTKEVLPKVVSSTLPRGMGNTRGLKPKVFFKNDSTLGDSGSDNANT